MPGLTDRVSPTRLAIPRLSRELVPRPRLHELLARALDARLVLVSAPPGFGKTTALVDWLGASGTRSAWVSLDETDNDPVRFVRYLRAAVSGLTRESVLATEPSPDDPIETAAELAGLLAEHPEPSVLVLDDYHQIGAPDVQRVVSLLLERLPPQAHLVISTRADPMLPLARLRARGELLEIRADALRFTVDEARAFFAERMQLRLSEPDVATLVERTEGWPAVLQLAGLSLSRRPDVASGVRDFAATHRFVLDYVVEEVIAGLPRDTQEFLLETSILDRLSGPLCDAVTLGHDGQRRLEDFERSNLLIVPLDDERRWYRYHALFVEILRARLASLRPDAVATLHARASAFCEDQGDDEAAIAHAVASGDAERAATIVALVARRHLNAGEIRTVRRWLDALPREVVDQRAQLSAAYAWCQLLGGETDGVADRLAAADRALAVAGEMPEAVTGVPAQLAMLRSQLAGMQGDAEAAVAQARLACALVPPGLPAIAGANLRGTASSLLGLALARAGELDAAADAYETALPDLRAADNDLAVGRTVADLAGIEIRRGNPARALALCEAELDAGRQADETDRPAARSRAVWSALARARAELGQLDAAEAAARRALDLATRAGEAGVARSAEETLRRVAVVGVAGPARRAARHPGGLVESLTERELEVLRQVALGRSNTRIATELFVTVGTVKAHIHSICGKLGAANRVQAIVRGRELGILD